MASGKGAGSTKSTNFGLLWGSLHFGGPRSRKSSKIHGSLGNGFQKRSGLYKIDKFWAFVGFPPCRRSHNPEIQENPQGPWKWLPEKERALQNQILGFCGVPSISAVPEAGNPGKSTGALEMASGKGADSTKSTNFGLLWGSLHFGGPRSRKSSKSTGALEMASGKGAGSIKSTNFGLLCGSLHFGGPRSRKSSKSTGALEMASGKGADSPTNFELLWGYLHFGGPRSRKSSKSTGALEMASGKGAGSTKSTNFGLLWGSLHFGGPKSRKSRKSTGALEMASGKGADSTKSTNFGLLWGSLHFGGPRSRKSRKIHRSLGNGFRKRSGLYKIDKFWACGVPSISAVPEAGNPANP